MIFIPTPPSHEYRPGETIKLAGRSGLIDQIDNDPSDSSTYPYSEHVKWQDDGEEEWMSLKKFPLCELGIEEPKIDEAACKKIKEILEAERSLAERNSDYYLERVGKRLDQMVEKPKA